MSIAWNRSAAAHLARRAGFGATPAELDAYVALGLDATVDQFVRFDGIDNSSMEADLVRLTQVTPPATSPIYDLTNVTGIQKWFLHRMVNTRRPLEEKMTYFWNLHFTSGISKVNDTTLILNQNKLERTMAVGRFDDLVLEITKDPAMMIWLDNATNVQSHPNENYARELMELFTLGVDRYTQTDVTEVARALTGWTITKASGAPVSQYTFFFSAANHDAGSKTILGQTGNWDAPDAIRIILSAADARGSLSGRFLARKLWEHFAYADPPDFVVADLAAAYVSSDHSIRSMLDLLFRHPEFYEAHARGTLVRSPVEYAVAVLRQLQASTDMSAPANNLTAMGQFLFNPVDAKGWEGGLSWMNTGTVFARASFVNGIVNNRGTTGTRIDLTALLAGRSTATAADLDAAIADRFGLADAAPQSRAVWEKYADAKADGTRGYYQNTPAVLDQKARGLLHLMLTSPDFHFC
jgi:uncharacterized protein (DUF1800 family)